MLDKSFWERKKVFLTGHTGFKGSWMLVLLHHLKAKVKGYSLAPAEHSMFPLIKGADLCENIIGDIRDFVSLKKHIIDFKPDIIIHLAAQALVFVGYENPLGAYSANVFGTANLFEAVRVSGLQPITVNVTTDKVYKKPFFAEHHKETGQLGGKDPYSSSKACSELVTESFRESFGLNIATARAGNAIGGGDFAESRLIPDCARAVQTDGVLVLRNGGAVRPWQFVLEPLAAYLKIAERVAERGKDYCTAFNIGPDLTEYKTVDEVAEMFFDAFGKKPAITEDKSKRPYETETLILDNGKAKKLLDFAPRYSTREAIIKTAEWTKKYAAGGDMFKVTLEQIKEFLDGKR